MINHSFSQQTYENWEQKAEESLKGKSVESLVTHTYENIPLKPLYTEEDVDKENISQYPGEEDLRRGSNHLGYVSSPWKIAQRIETNDTEEFKSQLTSSFEKGQTSIAFTPSISILKELPQLLEDVYQQYPFCVNGANYQNEIIQDLSQLNESGKITGYIGKDPVSLFMKEKGEKEELEQVYNRLAETIKTTSKNSPSLKTLLVDVSPYHNSGANAVQELAIAFSTLICHVENLQKREIEIEQILNKVVFHFSIGGNFFMEIGKLRAAKVLWGKVLEAYDISAENIEKMVISAETSWFTKTAYDPYVNLLRAGNEAFAAVSGGVQYLHVSPYNEPEGKTTNFSDRIARNTQLILSEESRLSAVVDPAGGSWYVESLTDQLIQEAWSLFLEIDEKGGITEVIKTNWLQDKIKEVRAKREKDIFTRKQSIVGTNKYAQLQETPLAVNLQDSDLSEQKANVEMRLSEPYEKLRQKAERLKANEKEPVIGLICLGKLKDHKPRADFVTDFLSPGGIRADKSKEIDAVEEALQFIKSSNYPFYVLCGSNQDYDRLSIDIVNAVKTTYPNTELCLAGLPSQEDQKVLVENGLSQFIHVKSNCYEMNHFFLNEMEVR